MDHTLVDCSTIGSWSNNDEKVCDLKDICDSNCDEICYDDFSADCHGFIQENCQVAWASKDDGGLEACMNALIGNATTTCCESSYNAVVDKTCLIPQSMPSLSLSLSLSLSFLCV